MQIAQNFDQIEAGIDEAGRGSLLGRLYVGAAIFLPDVELNPKLVKDSKRFSSRRRRLEARDYILGKCLSYGVAYCEPWEIDQHGLMPSLMKAMHEAIRKLEIIPEHLLVDGNYFEPYFHPQKPGFEMIPHTCVIRGDSTYYSIAAASILAKVAHDEHIEQLVKENPILSEYGIDRNMGYGARQHLEMLETIGPTKFHRKSFGRVAKQEQEQL